MLGIGNLVAGNSHTHCNLRSYIIGLVISLDSWHTLWRRQGSLITRLHLLCDQLRESSLRVWRQLSGQRGSKRINIRLLDNGLIESVTSSRKRVGILRECVPNRGTA